MNVTPPTSPPLPLLIGFGGLFESGKDTSADYLVAAHGFVKINMSDPIDAALYALNPIVRVNTAILLEVKVERYQDIRDEIGYTEAKKIPEVRALLQRLGVKVGRKIIDQAVWVKIASRNIQKLREAGTPVCVSGIRFPDEQELIHRLGGTLVWVERPGHARTNTSINQDATETGVTEASFDQTLINDNTIEALHRQTDRLVAALTGHDRKVAV